MVSYKLVYRNTFESGITIRCALISELCNNIFLIFLYKETLFLHLHYYTVEQIYKACVDAARKYYINLIVYI